MKYIYTGLGVCAILAMVALSPYVFNMTNRSGNHGNQSNGKSALAESRAIIAAILADVGATYDHGDGGGISAIHQKATNTYEVSISQEERVDTITYVVEVRQDNTVVILNRTANTKSY